MCSKCSQEITSFDNEQFVLQKTNLQRILCMPFPTPIFTSSSFDWKIIPTQALAERKNLIYTIATPNLYKFSETTWVSTGLTLERKDYEIQKGYKG